MYFTCFFLVRENDLCVIPTSKPALKSPLFKPAKFCFCPILKPSSSASTQGVFSNLRDSGILLTAGVLLAGSQIGVSLDQNPVVPDHRWHFGFVLPRRFEVFGCRNFVMRKLFQGNPRGEKCDLPEPRRRRGMAELTICYISIYLCISERCCVRLKRSFALLLIFFC